MRREASINLCAMIWQYLSNQQVKVLLSQMKALVVLKAAKNRATRCALMCKFLRNPLRALLLKGTQ